MHGVNVHISLRLEAHEHRDELTPADAAGGDWPERSRAAALYLVAEAKESTPSLGVRLLADLRGVFGDHKAMSTEDILAALHGLDESQWNDLRGNPLDARGLANRLRPYGVSSTKVRIGSDSVRGYRREYLHDAWTRYLPAPQPAPRDVPDVPDVPAPMVDTPPQKTKKRETEASGVGVAAYGSGTSGTSGTSEAAAACGVDSVTPPMCARSVDAAPPHSLLWETDNPDFDDHPRYGREPE